MQSGKLWGQVQSLMKCIDDVDKNLDIQQIPDKVLLLMGQTKAGKTTLMYYLLKKKLLLQQNYDLGISVLKADAIFHDYIIGDSHESATVYPNIPPQFDDNCMIIDMPGFNDTRQMYRLLNIYIIRKTIQKIKNVHVSFVIPFQSLEGQNLYRSLRNSCQILDTDFLKAQRCSSFILTKIEDKEEDKQNFKEHLKELQEQFAEQAIGSFAANLEDTSIYLFCRQNPSLEEGGKLKQSIVSENEFYPINQNPDKLLSSKYTETMIGESNIKQFVEYSFNLFQQIKQYMPLLLELVTDLLTYRYFDLIAGSLSWDQEYKQAIQKIIQSKLQKLSFCKLSESKLNNEISSGSCQRKMFELLKQMNFYAKNQGKQQTIEKIEIIAGLGSGSIQQDNPNRELTKQVNYIVRNSLIIIKTLKEVKSPQLLDEIQNIESVSDIDTLFVTIDKMFNVAAAQNLLSLPQTQDILINNENIKRFVEDNFSELFGSSAQAKTIFILSHGQIKNSKWGDSMRKALATKDTGKGNKKVTATTLMPDQGLRQFRTLHEKLQKLSTNDQNIKTLILSIRKYEELSQGGSLQAEQIEYKVALWKRAIRMLSDLRLFEEAILMSLGLLDLPTAEELIDQGIEFRQISSEFVKELLVPYYSQAEMDFAIIQRLFNFLQDDSSTISEIRQNNTLYSNTVQKMKKRLSSPNQESQYIRKRFNLEFIDGFTDEDGINATVEAARRNMKFLSCSKLANKSAQDQMSALK